MFRKNSLGVSVLVLALVLTASVPAFANNTRHVTLHQDMVLLGTPLQAGEYTISWASHSATATVTVSRKKDVLATAEGKLVERGKKYDRNAVLFDTSADGTNAIREIRLGGSSQAIVFFE
jgi:hypothetical protein